MLEKDLIVKIRKVLKERGATCHKHHGSAFAEVGVSDLFGTLPGGRAYFIEVKAPGKIKTATPAQIAFLLEEAKHGAATALIDSMEDLDKFLEVSLKTC